MKFVSLQQINRGLVAKQVSMKEPIRNDSLVVLFLCTVLMKCITVLEVCFLSGCKSLWLAKANPCQKWVVMPNRDSFNAAYSD